MGDVGLLHTIDAIYASALNPERWPEALNHIAQSIGGLGAVIVPLNATCGMTVLASASLEEAKQDYLREWWRHDVRNERGLARGFTSGLITDADLLDEETFRTHPFCQDFLRPHGLGAYIGYVTKLPSQQIVSVGVHRAIRQGPFERTEVEGFARLAPHAVRAITAGAEIAQGRRTAQTLGDTLERLTYGAILLNTHGIVVHVNEAAQAMLGAGFNISRGRLVAATSQDQRALDRLVASALPGQTTLVHPPLMLICKAKGGEKKLFVQAIPINRSRETSFEHLALGPGALVLINDLSASALGGVQEHLIRLGLTRGQARIAAAVGSGLSSREAAAHLQLAEGTIRTVLKAVYDRLGISRQGQLVALVTKLGSFNLM